MRSRAWVTWLVFGLSALLIVEVLAWAGWRMLRLEQRSEHEQVVRVALWRMDSLVTPIIATEAARPYFHYLPYYPATRSYEAMFDPVTPGEPLAVSPLFEQALGDDLVRLNFQIDPNGTLTSPQAPGAGGLLEAVPTGASRAMLGEERLARLQSVLGKDVFTLPRTRLGFDDGAMIALDESSGEENEDLGAEGSYDFAARQEAIENIQRRAGRQDNLKLSDRDTAPLEADEEEVPRAAALESTDDEFRKRRQNEAVPVDTAPGVIVTAFAPEWRPDADGDEELILRREVIVGDDTYEQGVWIDWTELRRRLLDDVNDLLPSAALEPVAPGTGGQGSARLATIPVRLIPGEIASSRAGLIGTPARLTLTLTALAVLAAIIAVGLVLRASLALSERRGRFVTAVTHELRTPLTTFRLYSQMLADGMVSEEKRGGYLATLKDESSRLARIVENVLEYARLGRSRGVVKVAATQDADDLFDAVLPALSARADRDGMELVVERPDSLGVGVEASSDTIERILMNLVENACKYAGDADDKRIHLEAAVRNGALELTVRDHGPGVPAPDRRRVFGAFNRGKSERDGPNPGLGLGLALARGLAEQCSGRLMLVRVAGAGAAFRLTLPVAR